MTDEELSEIELLYIRGYVHRPEAKQENAIKRLIAEVRRLQWFKVALHHVLGGGPCPWCLGEEAHHEETHKPDCEYIAHRGAP